jgi:histidine ammonia-lyase
MNRIKITGDSLNPEHIYDVAVRDYRVDIEQSAIDRMQRSRTCIEDLIASGKTVYGVNTGFGKLADIHISETELDELQLNLVLSHACGTGDFIPAPIVRAAMLLKVNTLCKGFSGTRPEIASFLVDMLNRGVIPCIPQKGSVGASGDLAPLAHMTLVLLGMGEAWVKGKRISGSEALKKVDLKPISLRAKEGLALLNGTQIMSAYAVLNIIRANNLVKLADIAGGITVESLLGTKVAFDERIQTARGFAEQIRVASNLRSMMAESEIVESHKNCGKVQDAYSSRCIPQVHGAVRDAVRYVERVVNTEINACTDNPLIFYEEKDVLSGGNFHGQPIALACDILAIALAQLANISERRLENLMDPVQSGLPPFLASNSGTNSGFMIAQVTAAALVSENKVLCHPASVDSIPTSANQEDFVSMGAHAARKAGEVIDNAETVLGIELLAGCQALDLRKNKKPGTGSKAVFDAVRREISTLQRDRLLHNDILKIRQLIENNTIIDAAESVIGVL